MKKKISIVGGGSCALMLGCELDTNRYDVTIYEKNVALARKFLVAGDGGLNLTHSEAPAKFILRYTPHSFLEEAFAHFSNQDFITWINELGIKTFVGTSGRVFPEKGIKPAAVLKSITQEIARNSTRVLTGYEWKGFSGNNLLMESGGETTEVKSDAVIFCLGGASWPVTGSKGDWTSYFESKNILTKPFEASNCAFSVNWPKEFIDKAEGQALKNVTLYCGGKSHSGEVVVTREGLEGSGIYPLSPQIREQLSAKGRAVIHIDLKPQVTLEKMEMKLKAIGKNKNYTEQLKTNVKLDNTVLRVLKNFTSKEEFQDPVRLAWRIKNLEITIAGTGPIEDAISTTGGIALTEINKHFELKKMPAHFVIGEMLDYDAPTGGYLLQSCFSMGKFVADFLNKE